MVLAEETLHSVFSLPHLQAYTNQQSGSCLNLSHLFKEYTKALQQEGGSAANGVSAAPGGQQQLSVNNKLWPGIPTDGLQTLCTAADVVSS
eukprot:CAMPEP_0202388164 /NCGR_PEP_ID=MMETSP1127-20130417/76020_1 /ASSEMBLY_ACC=CAM_ASM_000462 /TAXON_ID=3047 /ORGANISM="Dunaliella tertiolecta, Strain CCMP1320" /LENGTH=90 /DNA_ID=CAMNT_0048989481 /DNA_START=66 /DNA_END=335 /DNA_ORIENTATION=+